MANKSEYLTLRISKEDKAKIAAIAGQERRTISQVASLMLGYAVMMKWEMVLKGNTERKQAELAARRTEKGKP